MNIFFTFTKKIIIYSLNFYIVMKRKNPLSVISVVLISLLVSLSSCKQAEEVEKYIGIQLWSVRADMNEDPTATIQAIGEMEYKFIEAAGYNDGKFYGMEPAEFKALLNENNLDFISSHTRTFLPDSSTWDEAMDWWKKAIDAHLEAGCSYVIQPSLSQEAFDSLAGLQRYCDYFNAIGAMANEKGAKFGFHNHAKEFDTLEGEVIYDYMLSNTNPDKVFYQMDVYWVIEGGADPVAYFEKYPGRFMFLHIKDSAEVGASGNIDFERIFTNIDQSGAKYLVVEVEKYNYEPLESVQKSLEYLLEADFVE